MQIPLFVCTGETGQVDGTQNHAEKDKYYQWSPTAICKTHILNKNQIAQAKCFVFLL